MTKGYAFEHEGKAYTPDGLLPEGADVTAHNKALEEAELSYIASKPDRLIAYLSSDMHRVTTWTGAELGTARVVKSWRMPHSWQSSRQYQVECVINGVLYTGRSMGGGMLWRGQRKAKQ